MYRCILCFKVYKKRKNAIEHVINDHKTNKMLAQVYVMEIGDVFRMFEKPVDEETQ